MKNIVLIILGLFLCSEIIEAKKVKFSVDMTGIEISPNGVHITGDFQLLAGYEDDWLSDATKMEKEAGSDVYSVIVDIPAFRKYEFKFVNGDQFYEVEFVPVESRVGYDFIDNRWLYLDSLDNSVYEHPRIIFSSNAPAGKYLLRFSLDFIDASEISENGVHLLSEFNNYSILNQRLFSFDGQIYEIISYVGTGTYKYKFMNGKTSETEESLPSECAVDGYRTVEVADNLVLDAVCFGECYDCFTSSVIDHNVKLYDCFPNPALNMINIELPYISNYQIYITDLTGTLISEREIINSDIITESVGSLLSGYYLIKIFNKITRQVYTSKFTKL